MQTEVIPITQAPPTTPRAFSDSNSTACATIEPSPTPEAPQRSDVNVPEAIDHVQADGRWSFNEEVARVFDDMLARSIPQYDVMRKAVFDVGCRYVQPGTAIVDLGCSRGEALAPFIDRFGALNRFLGVEVSAPMLAACRHRFKGYIDCGVVDIRDLDLRKSYPPVAASLTLCVLTLQFIPIEHRARVLRDMYDRTVKGGAVILVEKVLGSSAGVDGLLTEEYYRLKAAHGYSCEEIERKKAALEGVLVPVAAKWNEDLLHSAGFGQVECFWRWMNFAAWVAVK
ncbi:MAG: methyltransferase domain-containing protein [Planctomycetia bacterium]|nr:MAG: methyltransferase domain-containing protein [Planctomycetia bacterium]